LEKKDKNPELNGKKQFPKLNMLSVSSRIQFLCLTVGPKLSVYRMLGFSGAIVSRILLFSTDVTHGVSRRVVRLSVCLSLDYTPPTAFTKTDGRQTVALCSVVRARARTS
jgi:hypothetical protein